MTTAMYAVEGMMCESCMAAVLENVSSLSGVTLVTMDLVAGGQSPLIVTSGTKLGPDAVRDAVEHVGLRRPAAEAPRAGRPRQQPRHPGYVTSSDRECNTVSTGGLRS